MVQEDEPEEYGDGVEAGLRDENQAVCVNDDDDEFLGA